MLTVLYIALVFFLVLANGFFVASGIKHDNGGYVLDGMLAVRAANQQLKLNLRENNGYTTLAGFLLDQAGRILHAGDEVHYNGGAFHIERVEGKRILRVRFERNSQ